MTDPVYAVGIEFVTGSFTDITDDVLRVTAQRALANGFDPLTPGDCSILLDNMTGKYSPEYSGSTFAGLMRPNLQVKVQATHSGSTYNVFRGYIDDWTVDPGLETQRRTTLACRDTLKRVQKSVITTSLYLDMPVTSFATIVLSEMNVTSFSVSSMADTMGFQWFQTQPAMTAVQDILASGFFFGYVDGGGTLTIKPRSVIFPGSVIDSLTNFLSMDYRLADDALINKAQVEYSTRDLPLNPQSVAVLSTDSGQIIMSFTSPRKSFAIEMRDKYGVPNPATYLMPPHYGAAFNYVGEGSSRWLVCSAALANATNTKLGTLAARLLPIALSPNSLDIIAGTTYTVQIQSGGNLAVALKAVAGGADIFSFRTRNGSMSTASHDNIAMSWNTGTGSAQVMVNSAVKSLQVLTAAVNTSIAYATSGNVAFRVRTSADQYFEAKHLWFDNLIESDLSGGGYSLFFSNDNMPGWMGENGENVVGTPPLIYLYNPSGSFGTNRGRGSSYGLTVTGTYGLLIPPGRDQYFKIRATTGAGAAEYLCSLNMIISGQTIVCSVWMDTDAGHPAPLNSLWLTNFTVRGFPAQLSGRGITETNNGSSQSLYGAYDRLVQNQFLSVVSYANTYAEFITSRYAYPRAEVNIAVANDFPALLGWELGQQIFITNTLAAIGKYSIKNLSHDIEMGAGLQHVATATLEKVRGLMYLNLPGATGDYASTPDSAALDITGDIQIDAWIQADDYSTAANQNIVAKWTSSGNQRAYKLRIVAGGGALGLDISQNGSSQININSTANIPGIDGAGIWVRVTLDVDDGAGNRVTKFYTSADGETWAQLGSTVTTAGTVSIFASTANLRVGQQNQSGSESPFSGRIYRTRIYNGIGGTLAADFNTEDGDPGASTLTSSATGEVWTMNGNAALVES